MKIQNPFRLGLLAGLGVLVALLIGGALGSLTTILTYVGAALFLALGIDPLVTMLERRRVPRPAAILTVLIVILGSFTGIIFAIVPAISAQVGELTSRWDALVESLSDSSLINDLDRQFGTFFDVQKAVDQGATWLQNNVGLIGNGVLQAGISVVNGLFGAVIVIILMLYFVASLGSMKRGLYQLVPASKRARFADITEQITTSIGRFVVGQATLALCNGVLSFIFLTAIGAQLPAVFAFIAFLFSLVPLVGTLTGSVIVVLGQVLLLTESEATWITTAVYYLIYMQVEAYLLSPNIMNRAVKVPGVIVVVAALTGGTLLGILGALIAIPVAAAILLIIKQVFIPRQNER
jgi:predicted PurR-regulated permease PerM